MLAELQLLILITLLTFAGAMLFGSVPLLTPARAPARLLQRLTGVAAGFLIGAAFLVVVPEGFELLLDARGEHDEAHAPGVLYTGGLAILAGFVLMLVLESFGFGHDLHEEHHDHSQHHGHDHVNHPSGRPTAIVIGLTVHALTDGLVIGAAIAAQELAITLQLAVVILMHKFPAAFSVTAFSLHGRRSRRLTHLDLLLFSLATPVATVLSWSMLSDLNGEWQALALLFSAGTFLYVATVDVLPQIHDRGQARSVLVTVSIGLVAMLVVTMAISTLLEGVHLH